MALPNADTYTERTNLPSLGKGSFAINSTKRSIQYDSKLHIHDYFEIYYLLSGERNYFIKDKVYPISRGDLVFINTYELHKTTATLIPDHERIVVYFRNDFLEPDHRLLSEIHSPFLMGTPVLSLPVFGQKFVEELLYKMLSEFHNREEEFETNLKALLLELLIFGLRSNRKNQDKPDVYENHLNKKVSEIIQYINKSYSQRLTLKSLSNQFFISPFYLSRIFRSTTGTSFMEYLTLVRIKEAQKLLRDTDRKVIMIVEDVGFNNLAHFGRMFKKITHCSPLQYRKMNR